MAVSPPTTPQLIELLERSGYVEGARLQTFLQNLPEDIRNSNEPNELAKALVEHKILTGFQAEMLAKGRIRSLRFTPKYWLLDRLGAGGMGTVYLCQHIKMKRLVAVKVLPVERAIDTSYVQRFMREAEAVAKLKHPNIVQAYDVDTEGKLHFLVMEYVPGIDLQKLVLKHGPLDVRLATDYIRQAAQGLHHAHENSLVHRDVKPSNLLVDPTGVVKVLDLGLARFFDNSASEITKQLDHPIIGTADFISPEQALNSTKVDARSDQYSLGCTYYYLLAGRAPFHGMNTTQKLLLHQVKDPPSLSSLRPQIDPQVLSFLARMMAKRPAERYSSAKELAETLTNYLNSQPGGDTSIPRLSIPVDPLNPGSGRQPPQSDSWEKQGLPLSGMEAQNTLDGQEKNSTSLATFPNGSASSLPIRSSGSSHVRIIWFFSGVLALGLALGIWFVMKQENPSETYPEQAKQNETKQRENAPKQSTTAVASLHPSGFREVSGEWTQLQGSPTDLFLLRDSHFHRLPPNLINTLVGSQQPIFPSILGIDPPGETPNTFWTIDVNKQLRRLTLKEPDYQIDPVWNASLTNQNVLIRKRTTLPEGMTTIQALNLEMNDLSAHSNGSTLKIQSGVVLIWGQSIQRTYQVGGGNGLLTWDFHNRMGWITLSHAKDFASVGRELLLRCKLQNFGPYPLVLSGLSGNIVSLDHPDNEQPELVIQGLALLHPERRFLVHFLQDGSLGKPGGKITLNQAELVYLARTDVVTAIDRPLEITEDQWGVLSVQQPESILEWAGPIQGGKWIKSGSGELIVSHADNQPSQVVVEAGRLLIQSKKGTPLGSGDIMVNREAVLSGSGRIPGPLTLQKDATLRPGWSEHALLPEQLKLEAGSILSISTVGTTVGLSIPEQAKAPVIEKARLQWHVPKDFEPSEGMIVPILENRSGQAVQGTFAKVRDGDHILSMNGKWSAQIRYQGNLRKRSATGGLDIVLCDLQKVS